MGKPLLPVLQQRCFLLINLSWLLDESRQTKPRSCTSLPVKISDGSLQTSSLAQRQRFGRGLCFDLLFRFHFVCKMVIIAKRPADRKLVRNSAAFQFRFLLRGNSTATEKTSTVSAGPRRFFKTRVRRLTITHRPHSIFPQTWRSVTDTHNRRENNNRPAAKEASVKTRDKHFRFTIIWAFQFNNIWEVISPFNESRTLHRKLAETSWSDKHTRLLHTKAQS